MFTFSFQAESPDEGALVEAAETKNATENAPPPRHPQVAQHDSPIATGSGEVRLVLHRPQQRRSHG